MRHTLSVLAASGRALEVNTSLPLDLRVVRWWREEGGRDLAFGSDAHSPGELARRFGEVAPAVEALGFRPAADPTQLWRGVILTSARCAAPAGTRGRSTTTGS